jgi:hypothetical protein
MFSALMTSRLRSMEGVEIRGGKGLSLQLRVNGNETTAQLERSYEQYRVAPATLTPVIDEFIQTLLRGERQEVRGTLAFEEIAPNLFPRLMTAPQWSAKRDAGLRLVIRPLVQDLGIALVIDHGDKVEFVQIEAIPLWGIDAQDAYDVALENLERAAAQIQTTSSGQGVELLLIDHHADGCAAARALLPSRWREWQAHIQDELVLAVPTRDLLLGFSRAHPAFHALRAQVLQDANTHPEGLFPNLLVVRDNALEIFTA